MLDLPQLSTADSVSAGYPNERLLVASVIGRLVLAARDLGWRGTRLVDAAWHEGDRLVAVAVAPGDGEVTVDQVSKFLKEARRAAKSNPKPRT